MFRSIVIFLIIILAAIFQVSFLPNFFFLKGVINIALILSVYWTLKDNFLSALPKIILMGFFVDLLSFYPIGFNIISLTVVGYIVDSFAKRFLVPYGIWSFGSMIFLIITGTIINDLVLYVLGGVVRHFDGNMLDTAFYFFDLRLLVGIFLNAVFFLLLYLPLRKLDKIIELYSGKKIIMK